MMFSPKVLIVDDQPNNLDVLVNYLADSGLDLMVATDGEQALHLATENNPDLVLLDVMMPGIDGFAVCQRLKAMPGTQDTPVIFMSALTDTESKVKGFDVGAIDFINKPIQREEVLARIKAHLTIRKQKEELLHKNRQLEQLNSELQEQINRREQVEKALHLADEKLTTLTRQEAERWGIDAFIGQSQAIRQLLEEVRSLQSAPHTNVLVLGESGTGKELISRAIHFGSGRRDKPFVAVNCSAIPSELADAEFFGHVKGAYTGASGDRNGYFVQADGGTLFLDEIGDMPLSLQAKLLRVLEDGLVTPIGGKQNRKVNVRIVAATNLNLPDKIHSKQFRKDLFFRLAGYQISLPPLRERTSDIHLLVDHFLNVLGRQMGRDKPEITREALAALSHYHFPGNVRELKNLIEYALIASRGQVIGIQHLHFLESFKPAQIAPLESNVLLEERKPIVSVETSSEYFSTGMTQEDALIEFAKSNGKVDNTSAQEYLKVDHSRASYLLKKLHKEGRLTKQGERRWTHYTAT